jgi:hypothetical protein
LEMLSQELPAWAGLELQFSKSQPPKYLDLQYVSLAQPQSSFECVPPLERLFVCVCVCVCVYDREIELRPNIYTVNI